jgi:hypothetical protein
MARRNTSGEHDTRSTTRSGRTKRGGWAATPPDQAAISTAPEPTRIVGLVSEHRRPKPGQIPIVTDVTEPEPARRVSVNEHDRPEPAPELSFGLRVESQGAGQVRAGAHGKPAIVALQRVLIALVLVAGAMAIVRSLRTSPEQPRRPDLGRCTEHIERTPHTEYIERTCTRAGS